MNIKRYRYNGEKKFRLEDYSTTDTAEFFSREAAEAQLATNQEQMSLLQERLYAENKEAVLIIFQAMDAAGKDSAVKHVMRGMNPEGIVVHNFKQPSSEELDHDYLWRAMRALPARGNIGIFNRSYYEDVLVVKVHKLYESLPLPDRCKTDKIFKQRYQQINNFEKYLHQNGIRVVKIFLHLSKEEQKKRFLKRIDDPEKNWKFSEADIAERAHWDEYQDAYQEAIRATSTKIAPWYIVPADKKWFARLLISQIVVDTLKEIDPQYPELPETKRNLLLQCRDQLLAEDAANSCPEDTDAIQQAASVSDQQLEDDNQTGA